MVDHESMTMQSDPAGARQAAFIEHLSAHAFAPTLLRLEQLIGDACHSACKLDPLIGVIGVQN